MATPLEVLSAEAAVLDNAASMLALLGYVTSKVREVRRFRADCASLSTTCVSLYSTFLQHRSSLQQTPLRNEFWECIQETSLLVLECLDWNIVHVTFDVIAKHKFTSLKARLGEISKAFGLEVLVSQKETIPNFSFAMLVAYNGQDEPERRLNRDHNRAEISDGAVEPDAKCAGRRIQ